MKTRLRISLGILLLSVAHASLLRDAALLSKLEALVSEGLKHLNESISSATPKQTLNDSTASPGLDHFSFFSAQRGSAMGKLKDSLQNHTGIQIGKSAFSEAVAEWASSRAKRATTPAEAAFWSAPLIGKLLVLADAAKDAEQSVRDAYFAFWVGFYRHEHFTRDFHCSTQLDFQ